MHFNIKKLAIVTMVIFVFAPLAVFAHQPRVVVSDEVIVESPEISKAYYAQLNGKPQVYKIDATQPFNFYVNILLPDIAGQKKDVSVIVTKVGEANSLATLGGEGTEWKRFYEDYGRDWYLQGPEYKARAQAGEYKITVSSLNNDSKYSLAIGEIESFGFKEGYNAMRLVPQIKKNFFNESPAGFIASPFGYGYIITLFVSSFVFGFIYRIVIKKFAKNLNRRLSHNIGKPDRALRLVLAIALFILAIFTSWSPLLFFFSGFCLFEAIFSWCGLYAALGKNSCPI